MNAPLAIVTRRIIELVSQLGHGEVSASSRLLTSGLVRPGNMVTLLQRVEFEFGILLADRELHVMSIDTPEGLAGVVVARLSEGDANRAEASRIGI